jgi:hypothetical protein
LRWYVVYHSGLGLKRGRRRGRLGRRKRRTIDVLSLAVYRYKGTKTIIA